VETSSITKDVDLLRNSPEPELGREVTQQDLVSARARAIRQAGSLEAALTSGTVPAEITVTVSEGVVLGLLRQGVRKYLVVLSHGNTDLGEILRIYSDEGVVRVFHCRNEIAMTHAATSPESDKPFKVEQRGIDALLLHRLNRGRAVLSTRSAVRSTGRSKPSAVSSRRMHSPGFWTGTGLLARVVASVLAPLGWFDGASVELALGSQRPLSRLMWGVTSGAIIMPSRAPRCAPCATCASATGRGGSPSNHRQAS